MPETSVKTTDLKTNSDNGKTSQEDIFDVIIREAGYRRCLILEGNVRDLFADNKGNYRSLSEILSQRLSAMRMEDRRCFTICGLWDRIDGLRFADPMMIRCFQRALKNSSTASSDLPESNQTEQYDDGSGRETVPETNPSCAGQHSGLYTQPEQALPAMRQLLTHKTERAVFILDWTEHLLGSSTHHDLDERQFLTAMAKAVSEQPVTGPDALKGPTGLLVIITSDSAALPASIYKDNPRTKIIAIPKPNRPQRLAFFNHNLRDLRVAEPKDTPERQVGRFSSCEATLSQITDLCDDLTVIDMQNILALSCQLSSKLRPDRLVNLYNFGKQNSPWRDLDDKRLDNVAKELKKRVMGQDHAVEAVEAMLQSAYIDLDGSEKQKQPKGKLFLVGPTGVGKTELARALAEFVFGDENALIYLDMADYGQEQDVQRLAGAPPSYVGFERGGELTNKIRQKPFCVVVFDEIEKAHGKLFDRFLQILEEGRLTDGRGQTVFFDQTITIFTSNIGQDCGERKLAALEPAELEAHFKESVIRYFANPIHKGGLNRPELVDRIGEDNIIPFHYIIDPVVRKNILRGKLVDLKEKIHERFGMHFEVSDRCIDWLESQSRTGIIRRDITNIVKRYFSKNRLARFIYQRRHQIKAGRTVIADVPAGEDKINFEIREAAENGTE